MLEAAVYSGLLLRGQSLVELLQRRPNLVQCVEPGGQTLLSPVETIEHRDLAPLRARPQCFAKLPLLGADRLQPFLLGTLRTRVPAPLCWKATDRRFAANVKGVGKKTWSDVATTVIHNA